MCWFSFKSAGDFELDQVRLPVRIGKLLRRYGYTITYDEVFTDVMKICAEVPKNKKEAGSVRASDYRELYKLGYAHSVEVWEGETGWRALRHPDGREPGESMFSLKPDASRIHLLRSALSSMLSA